jgi:hypothetical protein
MYFDLISQFVTWERESLLPFHSPTTILVSGCTQSGKTYFTKRLLENADGMFTVPPQKIMYAYSEYQPLFDVMRQTIPNIIFHQGLPDREELEALSEGMDHVVLVLDLMLKIMENMLGVCIHRPVPERQRSKTSLEFRFTNLTRSNQIFQTFFRPCYDADMATCWLIYHPIRTRLISCVPVFFLEKISWFMLQGCK